MMLSVALMGLIGLVLLIATGIVLIHFDIRARISRHTQP